MKIATHLVTLCFSLLLNVSFLAQGKSPAARHLRLTVGIVVDQMRNEYIYRYWNRFGNGGFKRLVNQGFYFRNTHYNYIPTYTGPGHASIYTGTTPRQHGIIANEWFQKNSAVKTGCVQDSLVKPVGSRGRSGMASPRLLLSSTISDELKLSSNGRSKVYSISLKDRSAILPAGHAADGAFWMDDATGEFCSSSWYLADLPRWLKNFNDERLPRQYLEKWWSTLYPIETYSASCSDENKYEAVPNRKDFPVFPYEYKSFIEKGDFSIIRFTPFGNSLVKDLALECLVKEELGKDDTPDLLCLSFSSTDYIGHAYGPRSVEMEDTYLRLDKDLEDLLNRLDKEVGKGQYLVFLTADHGAAEVPMQMNEWKIPGGYSRETKLLRDIRKYFLSVYGDSNLVTGVCNDQVFLNEKRIEVARFDKDALEEKLCAFILTTPGMAEAYPSRILRYNGFPDNDPRTLVQNGFNNQLSGNVCYVLKPGWMEYAEKGTTHGSSYDYDTHIPLLFYGNAIQGGESMRRHNITQIAPSICELMRINRPNSSTPELLEELFR
ncbi:MAG TPA: alkaline phosphatase family protein [Bacteroidia bacterium]|nr:alkaline phosphatase family protein [Bacteroidia bacterium]